jgi:signal transduction histidine kinase
MLFFIYSYIYKKNIPFKYAGVIALLALPVILFLPTKLNVLAFNISTCEAVSGPLISYVYFLGSLAILSLIVAVILFLKSYFKNKDPLKLERIALLIGSILFLVFLTFSEFFAVFTGDYEVNLLGPIGMLLFILSITFIIVKYKTFNIKLAAPIALVFGLWGLVFSLLFVHTIQTVQIIVSLTLVLLVSFGLALIRSVRQEIKQRERIELLAKDLERANIRLKELDKQKSEFVSIASHQLRSPLTAIRGYASMLAEGSFGKLPDKALESAKRIEESAKLMAMSIEDYLNVSRIESGNMKYNLSDFNLRDMADNICDDLRAEAMKLGLVLLFRSDISSRGIVNADVGKTSQIIHNLINNSLKYTPKGSISVLVRDDIKKKKVYVEITDTGIGMSEKTQQTIFQKFERANNANSVNVSGTGLGLYVALKMAEAMGGDISAKSEGDGKGSTFTFDLPLAM